MEMILRNLRNKKSAAMTESWIEDVFMAEEDDLSSWEVIDPSDDENEDNFSFDEEEDDEEDESNLESLSSKIFSQSPPENVVDLAEINHIDHFRKEFPKRLPIVGRFGSNYHYHQYCRDEDDEEEESDEYESDDLDDELVPKSVSGRFGRNRMRKLGKREYSKMSKSKRLPFLYNRPGCVHGKHGLGLKHSIM